MAPGLFNAKGEYTEFGEDIDHKSLTAEMATAAAVGEDVGGMLGGMPDPDPVLRKRGDDAKVLEDLAADDQVTAAIQNRKLRVLNLGNYDFNPGLLPGGDASKPAILLCTELTADLGPINLRDVFSELLDTPFYGYTVLEIMWEAEGGKYRLAGLVAKPREWFTFDNERRLCLKPKNGDPVPVPVGKFILVRHFPTYKNPYGLRLLSRCLWPVAFKRGGVGFYTRFLDRFGMPWPVGKSPKGADDKVKKEMAANLASMVRDACLVIPYGSEVDLMQSKMGTGVQFEKYLQRWDKAINKVLMGQTLTTEMDGQGSRAASETHYKVADDMAEADQFLVVSAMNNLAAIYRDINAPDVEAPVFGYHEPEDYQAQAELDTELYTVGVRFTPGHFERRFGLQPDEFTLEGETPPDDGTEPEGGTKSDAKSKTRPPGKKTRTGSGFAEDAGGLVGDDARPGQGLLDQFVEASLPAAVAKNTEFVDKLLGLLDAAESYDTVAILLAEHLGQDMDMEAQQDLLGDLMTVADLVGRADVAEEPDGD